VPMVDVALDTREQGRLAVELAACGNFPLAASIITLREARWFSNHLGQTMNRSHPDLCTISNCLTVLYEASS